VHTVIASALARLGVVLHLCRPEEEIKQSEVLCFLHHTKDDLLLEGHKVVGSAQRKLKGALVQHGGILLRQNPHTPELPGISELAGISLTATELTQAVESELTLSLGWKLVPKDWSSAEKDHIDELIHNRYAQPAWTYKR
jgi:lipoyl(octanoyl) transferase